VLTAIVSFNVFVAVLTSQVHEKVILDQKVSDKKLSRMEGDISETEREVETGFKEVLEELRALRREVEALKKG
jgi:voltage-gated sodium channel